jgi:hypothetical protein
MESVRVAIETMARSLAPVDRRSAAYLRAQAAKSPQEIADDLNIWGGAGSLMDQSHIPDPLNHRVAFEHGAIELAKALVAAGARNGRMQWWAERSRAPSEGSHDA